MDIPIKYEFILEPDRRPLSLDENDLRRPERIKMSFESICLAQHSMLVEEALMGSLPFKSRCPRWVKLRPRVASELGQFIL